MPNYCGYTIKIMGTKENCEKWIKKMEDYNEENHFYRIFDADVYECGGTESNYFMCISGDCAWSLESCCRASGYSNGVDLFEVNTRELNLVMEAWSEEPGIGFQEHYIYNKGECEADECEDAEFWWSEMIDGYGSYEDLKKNYPNAPSEEEFRETDGDIIVGGFDNYCQWNI